MSALPNKFEQ